MGRAPIRPHWASAGAFLRALALVVTGVSGAPQLRGKMAQVLVFDAGSSGTRIHIFNMYPPSDLEKGHVPDIDLSVRGRQTLKVKPGLSAFAKQGDYTGARQKVMELIEFANQFVPQERRAGTPIMLKATAGLRAVPTEQAQGVLMQVREGLAASGYRFQSVWADIIQGKEEGGLAWIAANYLKGTFAEEAGVEKHSLGVIEMGGGSTQVTFEVPVNATLADSDDFSFVTARGRQYRLYAHSYLGFGQDSAQNQLLAATPSSPEQDPCYPTGYHRRAIKGTGSSASCKADLKKEVMQATVGPGLYKMEQGLRGGFVATENFFFVQNDLAMKLEDLDVLQAGTLDTAGETACSKAMSPTAEEAAKMESGEANAGEPKHCFGLSYQAVLLQSLKAFETPGVTVQIAHQINGGDVDWALGAALVHYLEGNVGVSPPDGHVWSFMFALLLLGMAFLLYRVVRVPLLKQLKTSQVGARQVGARPTKIGVPIPAE